MTLALLADIHGNLEALEACLADAEAQGATRFAFLGDLVGYGPDPNAVVERAKVLTEHSGFTILGNHDQAAAGNDDTLARMSELAAVGIVWTRTVLTSAGADWLRELPLKHSENGVLYVHADARRPEQWAYIVDARHAERALRAVNERIVFCGHVHATTLYQMHEKRAPVPFTPAHGQPIPLLRSRLWLGVIGAVGQPRDADPRATYALLDDDCASLTLRRVRYDVDTTARKIRASGLPDKLADRLIHGV